LHSLSASDCTDSTLWEVNPIVLFILNAAAGTLQNHVFDPPDDSIKDLSLLNRDLSQTIIVDNNPEAYQLQPENAIGCTGFVADLSDTELWQVFPFAALHRHDHFCALSHISPLLYLSKCALLQIADFLLHIKSCPDVRTECK